MRKGKKSNMAKKKTTEKALNIDNILFNCRDYLRAARNSGEYYGAAEPPVRCGESHLSGLTEPPHFVY